MKRLFIFFIILSLSISGLFAQSRLAKLGLSALLPGTGEILMGKTDRGIVMLSADLISIYAFFKTDNDAKLYKDRFQKYAYDYAGVPLGKPDIHYHYIQKYYSSESYNDIQELSARNYYLIYNYDPEAYENYLEIYTFKGDDTWAWQSKKHWAEYKELRKNQKLSVMNHNLALGVMLLNRGISLIQTSILSRPANLAATPLPNNGIMLSYELRF